LDESVSQLLDSQLKKARQKLEVASRLIESGDYDDAVSRAYYAFTRPKRCWRAKAWRPTRMPESGHSFTSISSSRSVSIPSLGAT